MYILRFNIVVNCLNEVIILLYIILLYVWLCEVWKVGFFFLLIDKDNLFLFYSGRGLFIEVFSFGIFEIFVVVCFMRFF